jgi:proline iminopeptidase
MKRLLILIFLCLLQAAIKAQSVDSITLSNAVLYYSIKGEGKTILLLSGGPGTSANILDDLYESLSKKFRCVLLEQRGTGKSRTYPMDSTTINISQAAEDILILKKALGLEKITIVGHSYGSMLAMYFASRHAGDIDKLVLVSPGTLSLDQDFANDNRRSKLSKEEILYSRQVGDSIRNNTASPALQQKMAAIQLRLNIYDALKADSISQLISKRQRNPVMEKIMLADMAKNYNVRSAVGQFSFPFLVISGRQDPVAVFPTMDIMQLNRHAQIVWLNRCGHMPWVEQPQIFYQEVVKFLQ